MPRFEIFADEAWTHQSLPLRRYWCFYGGIFGAESDLGRLDTTLRGCAAAQRLGGEVKWSSVKPHNVQKYKAFVDCLFAELEKGTIRWRQMFCDRSLVRVASPGDKSDLTSFAEDLPRVLNRHRLTVRVTYHQSEHVPRIQVCDLIIGAAGSYGNRMHELREPGKRGMTPKQKARLDVCKHIYDRLRAIDAKTRGTRGFNWFESTGKDGDRANMLNHQVRVWKFVPRRHQIDKGWQRDNLGPAGSYRGPQLEAQIQSTDQSWSAY